jgi:hypothetical protein
VRQRKGDQQQPDSQHQPGLVGVPERTDRRDHRVLLGILRRGKQDADAQVEAVEDDVDQDREAHQPGEDQRHQSWPVEGHFALSWPI